MRKFIGTFLYPATSPERLRTHEDASCSPAISSRCHWVGFSTKIYLQPLSPVYLHALCVQETTMFHPPTMAKDGVLSCKCWKPSVGKTYYRWSLKVPSKILSSVLYDLPSLKYVYIYTCWFYLQLLKVVRKIFVIFPEGFFGGRCWELSSACLTTACMPSLAAQASNSLEGSK